MNEFDASGADRGLPAGPMTFSQILGRVWLILRGNLRLLLQMGTIPAAGFLATYALMFGAMFAFGVIPPQPGKPPDPQRMAAAFIPTVLLVCIPMAIVYALFEGAASSVALAANRGAESSFVKAWGGVWSKAGRMVWLMILRSLSIALPGMALFAVIGGVVALQVFAGGRNLNPGAMFVLMPVIVLAYVGSIVYAVWMALRLGLAVPACLQEGLTAFKALKRSIALTRGSLGRIFLAMLVVYAIGCAAIFALELVGVILGAVVLLIGSGLHVHLTQPWAGVGFGILALAIFGAFLLFMTLSWASYAITFSVLYDDQRMRLEGAARAADAYLL